MTEKTLDDRHSRCESRAGVLPLDRREYLKATGALTGLGIASTGGATAATGATDGSNDHEGRSRPVDLRIEYDREPDNVPPTGSRSDALREKPGFSWEVAGARGTAQSAYRVLVASTPENLANGTGDVWDSGKVESSQSVGITFDGSSLDPDTTYHWKVRIWDQDGRASDWSEPTRFTTAIPDTDEAWDGSWIGQSPDLEGGPADVDWSDYTLAADATIDRNGFGMVFRAQDEDNLYRWRIMLASSPHHDRDEHVLRPYVRQEDEWTALGTVSVHDQLAGAEYDQHRYEITLDGDQITTTIDGEQVDQRTDDTFDAGNFGIWANHFIPEMTEDSREAVYVDSVAVRGLDDSVLFETNFSDGVVKNFTDGVIRDGQLYYEGYSQFDYQHNSGVVHDVILHGSPFDSSPQMRTDVDLGGSIASARAHVLTLGYGELYVNGDRVGDEKLNPLWTDYTKRVVYSSYDVTDDLRSGENGVGLWLGRGFFSKRPSFYMSDRPWLQAPEGLVRINVTYEDGSTETITTDPSWTMRQSPILENDVYNGETYDARREEPNWATAGFDDADWAAVVERDAPGDDPIRQPQLTPPIKVTGTLEPQSITEVEDGYVVDFGQNHAGWTELTIRGASEGDSIEIQHGELAYDDGDVDRRTNRSAQARDVYVARGDDVETYEPRFTYHGYRYAKIIGYPGELTEDDVVGKVVHTDNEHAGSFECSNGKINQLQSNSVWGLRSNSHGILTDCCQRGERLGWTGDNQIAGRAYLYNFDAINFYRQWLDLVDDAQTPDNPHGVGQTVPPGGEGTWPNWGRVRVSLPWWVYEHSGDVRILEKHYGEMRAYVEAWEDDVEDGILRTFDIGDHMSPVQGTAKTHLLTTSAHYFTLDILSDAAAALGKDDDAEKYRKRADEIASALHEEFYSPETASYGAGTQVEYAVTLGYGMVPDDLEDQVLESLVDKIRNEDGGRLMTGFVGTGPLIRTLADHGYEDLAFHIITQPERPGWGYMLENGATTNWEGWNMPELLDQGGELTSRNHSPFNMVSEWFYKYLAGIQLGEAGFDHVRIAPNPAGDVEWASGQVDTVKGPVESSWELTEQSGRGARGTTLDVAVPGNATASVEIPTFGADKVRVRESGKTIWNNGNATRPNHAGVKSVERDGDTVVVEVSSGEYGFELEPLGK